jgi:uncharacterized protein (DUF934 family)
MRHILRRREWLADEWRYLGEEPAGAAEAAALIVPLAQWRADPQAWRGRSVRPGARLGVRLAPADGVEELAAELPYLRLVAVEFPNPGGGRGYTQGWLLRERFGFTGELRAVGAGVRQDQVFLLARCGFDALELAAGEDPQAAVRALGRYDVAYQPGAAQIAVRRQRFPRGPAAR